MNKLAPLEPVEFDRPRGLGSSSDAARGHSHGEAAHRLERAVQRRLLAQPDLRFSSLVVRRIPNGVCLEGVVESDSDLDFASLVRSVSGVDAVLNYLVVRRPRDAY